MPEPKHWKYMGVAAAGLAWAAAGCSSTPKSPLAANSAAQTATAVSGSGNFAPNSGPKDPTRIYLAYGQWQEQMGQQAEARESYAKVLKDEPKNIDAILGMSRLDAAAGLQADAEERLKKALKLAPKEPRVLATYGNFYALQKDWKRAVEMHQAAVNQAPDDPRYQFHLGVALARSGDVDAAYPYFVRAVGDAEAHFNIGYILYESGNRPLAMQHLEQALALKPDLAVAQTMLERVQQRGDNTYFAHGSGVGSAGAGAMQASGVRSIPLTKHQEMIPLRGNEAQLPRGAYSPSNQLPTTDARTAPTASPGVPAGMTPAQLEQLRNQQVQ